MTYDFDDPTLLTNLIDSMVSSLVRDKAVFDTPVDIMVVLYTSECSRAYNSATNTYTPVLLQELLYPSALANYLNELMLVNRHNIKSLLTTLDNWLLLPSDYASFVDPDNETIDSVDIYDDKDIITDLQSPTTNIPSSGSIDGDLNETPINLASTSSSDTPKNIDDFHLPVDPDIDIDEDFIVESPDDEDYILYGDDDAYILYGDMSKYNTETITDVKPVSTPKPHIVNKVVNPIGTPPKQRCEFEHLLIPGSTPVCSPPRPPSVLDSRHLGQSTINITSNSFSQSEFHSFF